MPAALERTLAQRDGFEAVVERLRHPGVKRVLVTGNGAAFYAAQCAALAALCGPSLGCEWLAIPAGLFAEERVPAREGDVLLVVSSSGELKDIVAPLAAGKIAAPVVAVTAKAQGTIGRAAEARALVHVESQRASTHTQGYVGNVLALLHIVASLRKDAALLEALQAAPEACARALADAPSWASDQAPKLASLRAAVVTGSGPAWPAAMETALLLKEVSMLPAEGMDSREGATSGMYALSPQQCLFSIRLTEDPFADETERICSRRGAIVVRVPGAALGPAELAPITAFPASLALAIAVGQAKGLNVDEPAWSKAYFETVRVSK